MDGKARREGSVATPALPPPACAGGTPGGRPPRTPLAAGVLLSVPRFALAALPAAAVAWVGDPWLTGTWFVAARIAYASYVATALRREETRQVFTRRGGPEEGFRRFRRTVSLLMDHDAAAFVGVCLVTRGTIPLPPAAEIGCIAAAAVLIVAGFAMKAWAAASVPPGTYYWRDFFVPPPPTAVSLSGPYRWFTHPMYSLGYIHAWGLALGLRSWPGLAASAMAQVAMFAVARWVEEPHYRRIYGEPADAPRPFLPPR